MDATMPESDLIFADQSLAIEVLRRQIQQRTASGARRMVSLRPDEAESLLSLIDDFFLGTCDWGDCDRLAVDTRFDHDKGPLPVCVQHSLPYALLEAEHAKLMSMVEKAASTLRELADMDDEGSPRLMVCAGEAKRTLKAMREIGGIE